MVIRTDIVIRMCWEEIFTFLNTLFLDDDFGNVEQNLRSSVRPRQPARSEPRSPHIQE